MAEAAPTPPAPHRLPTDWWQAVCVGTGVLQAAGLAAVWVGWPQWLAPLLLGFAVAWASLLSQRWTLHRGGPPLAIGAALVRMALLAGVLVAGSGGYPMKTAVALLGFFSYKGGVLLATMRLIRPKRR